MSEETPANDPPEAELRAALEALEHVAEDRGLLASLDAEERRRWAAAIERVAFPDRTSRRKLAREFRKRKQEAVAMERAADAERLNATGIRAQFQKDKPFALTNQAEGPSVRQTKKASPPEPFEPPPPPPACEDAEVRLRETLSEPRTCYACKAEYRRLHRFYDAMCPDCAELNWAKRHQTADLAGRWAMVTGGRVKIGYQAALKLLRAGAHVVVTTRFPRDGARRFLEEQDAADWRDRLMVHGLDLRHTPSVEALADHLVATLPRLDFLLNNACQTVRRPPAFYAHLMDDERRLADSLPEEARPLLASYESLRAEASDNALTTRELAAASIAGVTRAAELSQLELAPGDDTAGESLFPSGRYDVDEQQVDLRGVNSWRLKLAEVATVELLEVHLVNAVAPFLLNARLKPLMTRVPTRDKHIVNVSAMEGVFYRAFKTDKHPHTNMAKAALNMLTRTSAQDYVRDGIHMNSVDTGWITDEDPAHITERKRAELGFHPPLDIVDAAARICDPIFSGFKSGEHVWGKFLKDYRVANW